MPHMNIDDKTPEELADLLAHMATSDTAVKTPFILPLPHSDMDEILGEVMLTINQRRKTRTPERKLPAGFDKLTQQQVNATALSAMKMLSATGRDAVFNAHDKVTNVGVLLLKAHAKNEATAHQIVPVALTFLSQGVHMANALSRHGLVALGALADLSTNHDEVDAVLRRFTKDVSTMTDLATEAMNFAAQLMQTASPDRARDRAKAH